MGPFASDICIFDSINKYYYYTYVCIEYNTILFNNGTIKVNGVHSLVYVVHYKLV